METVRNGIFSTALAGALRQAGLSHRSYEFNRAVELAIEKPELEKLWLAGEEVFAGLSIDPESANDDPGLEAIRIAAFG